MRTVIVTPDERRALLRALKTGMIETAAGQPNSFWIVGLPQVQFVVGEP